MQMVFLLTFFFLSKGKMKGLKILISWIRNIGIIHLMNYNAVIT